MITRLALHNWRSHENTELAFGKGTNVIVGAMGSGKSSAINGICFGLFGTFPDLQSRKLRLDDVVMNKPARKQEASVTVDFVAGGKTYSVTRRIKRGKSAAASTAELRLDGNLVEGPQPSRVDEKVSELLKLDYDLFSRAVYSEQNAIDYFLEIPKGQRKQKIDELLKISKFENARKTLGTVITRLRDLVSEAQRTASAVPDFSELPKLRQAVVDGELVLVNLENRIVSILSAVVLAKEELGTLRLKEREFRELSGLAQSAEGAARLLEEKLARLEKSSVTPVELRVKMDELRKERDDAVAAQTGIQKLEKEYERENAVSNGAFADVERLEKKLSSLAKDDAAELQARIALLESAAQKMAGEAFSARHEIAQLSGELEALHRGGERCPVCETRLAPEKAGEIKASKAVRVRQLEASVRACEEALAKLNSEKVSLGERLTAAQQAAGERVAIEASLAALRSTLEKSARRQKEITTALADMRLPRKPEEIDVELRVLEKALEYHEAEQELRDKKETARLAREKAAAVRYDENEEAKAADNLKELEKQLALSRQEQRSSRSLLEERRKRMSELAAVKERAEQAARESHEMQESVAGFEQLQKALQDVQSSLRQEFTEETNVALTEVWRHVYPYMDYLALRLGVDDSGDYVLQLNSRNGDWVGVEGITSGGERSTACLALRIALSLVLTQNLSWLVLDEPTHNLDKNGIRELARTLRDHLPKLVDQVFIITHEEELESAASGNLYRFEREKERDEPTRIMVEG
ncbi:SMC family ATPase [Candidatus Micrarchaeota archaeon]|nr:SMC family ATPase [Candidatus Micrarchaeota archaeon]